mgnify:CR=1 FL=1
MDCLKQLNYFFIGIGFLFIFNACNTTSIQETIKKKPQNTIAMNKQQPEFNVIKTDEEWQNQLTPEQFYVLRNAGTERPFTGKFNMHFEKGTYTCAGCGEELFSSESKFDAHCGWPSFDQEIKNGKIIEKTDESHGMKRTEILCGNCGGHLGHVFDDGPTETGLRYCVNSLSLDFKSNQK